MISTDMIKKVIILLFFIVALLYITRKCYEKENEKISIRNILYLLILVLLLIQLVIVDIGPKRYKATVISDIKIEEVKSKYNSITIVTDKGNYEFLKSFSEVTVIPVEKKEQEAVVEEITQSLTIIGWVNDSLKKDYIKVYKYNNQR